MVQKSIDSFYEKRASKKKERSHKGRKGNISTETKDVSSIEGMIKMYGEIGHVEGIVDGYMELALHHISKKSLINALGAAEKALDSAMELNDERRALSLLLLGDLRYLSKDSSSATDYWDQVVQNPDSLDGQKLSAFLRLAWATLDEDSGTFESYLDQADAISPSLESALLMGLRLKKAGSLTDVEVWLKKALSLQEAPITSFVFKGVSILPESSETAIHELIGQVREECGRLREASEAYEKAGNYLARGNVLMKLGNLELALSAFETGQKRTGDPSFLINQAKVLIEMGNENQAVEILQKGEKQLKKRDVQYYIKGLDLQMEIHKKSGNLEVQANIQERKGDAYEELEEYDAMAQAHLHAVSILQSVKGDESWKRAVKIVRRVIEADSRSGWHQKQIEHRLMLEEMHLKKGKPVKKIYEENVEYCYSLRRPGLAVRFFQKEIELHKGREEDFLDYLHLARSYLSAGKRVESLSAYKEAQKWYKEPPQKGTILREMGYLYRVTGDKEKAIASLKKAASFYKRAKNKEGRVKALTELEKVYDGEVTREKMIRSGGVSEINKTKAKMEKLTDESNGHQKIIRETNKIVEKKRSEVHEWKKMLEQTRQEVTGNGTARKKQLVMMDKQRTAIGKNEETIDKLQHTIRELQSKKLEVQEEKAELKKKLMDLKKKDSEMKKKIEEIEMSGTKFRKQAMALDPMLSTSAKLETIEEDIYHQLAKGTIPKIRIPTRTKDNIEFSERDRVYRYSSGLSFRSAKSTDGANMLMRTAYVIDFIDDMIRTSRKGKNRTSTLRELYYISESWGKLAKFGTQNESNNLVEDLEIITRYLRENFHLRPEEDGARVIGNINLRERNRKGEWKTINCREDVGDSGYTIPYNAEKEKLKFKGVDADFVIAIETGGMFDRLVENGFDESARAVLVHIKGQPARSTRRFLKRLNVETRLPVLVFTDGDPWSYRIFASIAYGAIKTAHISHHLATPSAEYIGITPSDILKYDLPTDKLNDRDVEALNSELTDPRFSDSFWQGEITTQLKIKKKSEQQALAKYGLDFVTDSYLPEKLGEMGYLS